ESSPSQVCSEIIYHVSLQCTSRVEHDCPLSRMLNWCHLDPSSRESCGDQSSLHIFIIDYSVLYMCRTLVDLESQIGSRLCGYPNFPASLKSSRDFSTQLSKLEMIYIQC